MRPARGGKGAPLRILSRVTCGRVTGVACTQYMCRRCSSTCHTQRFTRHTSHFTHRILQVQQLLGGVRQELQHYGGYMSQMQHRNVPDATTALLLPYDHACCPKPQLINSLFRMTQYVSVIHRMLQNWKVTTACGIPNHPPPLCHQFLRCFSRELCPQVCVCVCVCVCVFLWCV